MESTRTTGGVDEENIRRLLNIPERIRKSEDVFEIANSLYQASFIRQLDVVTRCATYYTSCEVDSCVNEKETTGWLLRLWRGTAVRPYQGKSITEFKTWYPRAIASARRVPAKRSASYGCTKPLGLWMLYRLDISIYTWRGGQSGMFVKLPALIAVNVPKGQASRDAQRRTRSCRALMSTSLLTERTRSTLSYPVASRPR